MAGGYKNFGPTYNTTGFVRLGYEGLLNGTHDIDVAAAQAANGELAGKFAAVGTNGIKLAGEGGKGAVGLFREDLNDMINASEKATFYFRGGEYYVAIARTGFTSTSEIAVGDEITTNANGEMVKFDSAVVGARALGVVTHVGGYAAGNMFANAGTAANGGDFIGFIMYV